MEWVWFIFLFALGACVGSFLNVVIYRLPRRESIVFPGSHCPSCGRPIKGYDNIPILSWLLLRARCRSCKAPISPRYILVETVTGLLVAGLFAWYYMLDLREGVGVFERSWPTFLAHAALLCGLLACSMVDIEKWIVPLEVCWFVSLVGFVVAAAAAQPAVMPFVSPATGAMALAAVVGILIGLLLLHYGLIQPSFVDAEDKPVLAPPAPAAKGKAGKNGPKGEKAVPAPQIRSVAFGKEHGVNPRKEILRELIFLAPAILLAAAAYGLVTYVPAIGKAWNGLVQTGSLGRHFSGFLAALFGYLIGGLWIWGTRILGTLAFGKEAMGMGDVHILAAVGAVTGWIVPSVAFFLAPVFGLLWALYLLLARNQRELPYGPWLAAAAAVVMFFHNGIHEWLERYFAILGV